MSLKVNSGSDCGYTGREKCHPGPRDTSFERETEIADTSWE